MKKFRLLLTSFCLSFILNIAQAGIVEPVFKQLKDPNLDGVDDVPSPTGVNITPDGKKMFVMSHFDNKVYIYDLSTPFDISTMDVDNRTIVNTDGLGDNLTSDNSNNKIKFNNDGTKVFFFDEKGGAQFHNLATPYDVASISAATLIADDGINYTDTFVGTHAADSTKGVAFNNDGTKMYLVNGRQSLTDITQIKLTTPFDPSTGVSEHVLDTETNGDVARYTMDMAFDDDGTRLYLTESDTSVQKNYMYVWRLSDPFNLASATFVDKWQILGNGGNISPYGWTFGNNGMKLYIGTEDASTGDGDDIIYEYDLTCPYGVVLCDPETASVTSAQVEIAKNVIYQNSSNIFKRFDWLRRNEEKTNLNSHNIKLNINNPILASLKNNLESSLKNTLEKSFTDTEYSQVSLKNEKPNSNKRNWSYWSHVDISFGRVGDTLFSKPKEIKTKGIMFGADKLVNDRIFGYAFRYGNDEVDIKSNANNELDSQSFTLNIYGNIPLKNKSHLNALIGASFLSLDQLTSDIVSGKRNGKQVFTSLSYENENKYTKYDIIPFGKFELGVTQFSEYTDFGTSSTNSIETHESLTFKTGNVSTGFKFDSILYLDDRTLSRNGFVEYIYDLTPDIDHHYKNHVDNTTIKKTISAHSLHNIKGNIGFEYMKKDGYTVAINYERYQSLDDSAHIDSLLFKFGKKNNKNANLDLIYKPMNNNNTEISYLKELGNFNLKFNSNYSLFSKIPDYGANIELSGTF